MENIKETKDTETTIDKDNQDTTTDTQEKKVVENEKNNYNDNKIEREKSLEQEVQEAKDKKYLAEQIVKTNEELSTMRNDINTILSILKQNSNSFIDSQVKSTNSNDNNKNKNEKNYILDI